MVQYWFGREAYLREARELDIAVNTVDRIFFFRLFQRSRRSVFASIVPVNLSFLYNRLP